MTELQTISDSLIYKTRIIPWDIEGENNYKFVLEFYSDQESFVFGKFKLKYILIHREEIAIFLENNLYMDLEIKYIKYNIKFILTNKQFIAILQNKEDVINFINSKSPKIKKEDKIIDEAEEIILLKKELERVKYIFKEFHCKMESHLRVKDSLTKELYLITEKFNNFKKEINTIKLLLNESDNQLLKILGEKEKKILNRKIYEPETKIKITRLLQEIEEKYFNNVEKIQISKDPLLDNEKQIEIKKIAVKINNKFKSTEYN